ncbi:hypothetical protein DOY81_012634, partial [Sarcophaga bullata]
MSITAGMKLLNFFTILLGLITTACGICNVQLPEDPLLRPKIFQIIGLRKIELPIAKNTGILPLFHNQKIELHCDTEFTRPDNYVNEDKASVECTYGDYYYFECSPLKWKLYESAPKIYDCVHFSQASKGQQSDAVMNTGWYMFDTVANLFKTLYIGCHRNMLKF